MKSRSRLWVFFEVLKRIVGTLVLATIVGLFVVNIGFGLVGLLVEMATGYTGLLDFVIDNNDVVFWGSFALTAIPMLIYLFFDMFTMSGSNQVFETARGEAAPDTGFSLFLRPFDLENDYYLTLRTLTKELREFYSSEEVWVDKGNRTWPLGEVLVELTREISPVRVVGRKASSVGERRPDEIITSDEDWQAEVQGLLENASVIFFVPSNNPGTFWEAEQIFGRAALLRKTIFICPNSWHSLNLTGREALENWWDGVREQYQSLGAHLPGYGDALFFRAVEASPGAFDQPSKQVDRWSTTLFNSLDEFSNLFVDTAMDTGALDKTVRDDLIREVPGPDDAIYRRE